MVCFLLALTVSLIAGVSAVPDEVKSVKEGAPVALDTDVTKHHLDTVLWYFKDTLIARIIGDQSKSCLYDGEGGRFRDRLKVDYQTGSLTITDIRPEHTGRYEARISRSSGTSESLDRPCNRAKINRKQSDIGKIIKTFTVTIDDPDSGSSLSAGAVAGICVAVLLVCVAAAAVVICSKRRKFKNGSPSSLHGSEELNEENLYTY